jgi:hypothetical protein
MEDLFVIKTEIRESEIRLVYTHITLETKKMSNHPRRLDRYHGSDNCINASL